MNSQKRLLLQQEIDDWVQKPSTKTTTSKIEELKTQVKTLNTNFDSMATQLLLDDPSQKEGKKLEWLKEFENLTLPLLKAIRKLTEKPQMIDKLTNDILLLEERLEDHSRAYKHLTMLIAAKNFLSEPIDKASSAYISRLELLRSKYDPAVVKLNLKKAHVNLDEILKTEGSLIQSVTRQIKDFFKTRGRNLLVSIGTFFVLWWLLTRVRKWVTSIKFLDNLHPELNKLFAAVYNMFVIIFCLLASMACLFFFNDWLLISLLVLIALLGLWTSRQWIPKFFQEIKFIVNLGTVREGERIIWQGIPWLVKDIGLYATLVNERLQGGEIKLQVRELIGKQSRPVVENEPWFPTQPKDWVMLSDSFYGQSDSVYGQIEYQTIEQVVLRLYGGSLKYYATTDFLKCNPVNFSCGFFVRIEFGLEYSVQSKVCDQIPKLFQEQVRKLVHHHFEGDSPDFTSFEIQFNHAGSSSLNLVVLINVDGSCAYQKEKIRREIEAALVQVCNENDLVIPFEKLTINLAGNNLAAPLHHQSSENRPPKDRI